MIQNQKEMLIQKTVTIHNNFLHLQLPRTAQKPLDCFGNLNHAVCYATKLLSTKFLQIREDKMKVTLKKLISFEYELKFLAKCYRILGNKSVNIYNNIYPKRES